MSKKRVAVALSGGVDSTVAALILKKDGYDVLGVHMLLYTSPLADESAVCAERICRTLKVPFILVDLRREFERYVVDYFCREYQAGLTPNPCVACNRYVKFGFLLEDARSRDAEYLATGHYARIKRSVRGRRLLQAKYKQKDQSYFLYTLDQMKLTNIIFPLGDYSRAEVERIAYGEKLPRTAKSSQDVCFLSRENYRSFLDQRFSSSAGEIVDTMGQLLGRHRGVASYTVGQRRGVGLAMGDRAYVIKIDSENNRIVLGGEEELYSGGAIAEEVHWVCGEPSSVAGVTAKIRYKAKEVPVRLSLDGASATAWFACPQRAVSPGQAIVFYREEEVLGGGTIKSALPVGEETAG